MGKPAHLLAGLPAPRALITAYTISLGTPEQMSERAARSAGRALLKVKLGGDGDRARIGAVRRAAPNAELIVDANESWTADNLADNLAACAEAGVTLGEQPLSPAGKKNYRRRAGDALYGTGDCAAVDAGHSEVGDHDGERIFLRQSCGESFDSRLAAIGSNHLMPVVLQNVRERLQQKRVVIDHQHAFSGSDFPGDL